MATLVGFWRMEGDSTDASGNGNNGTDTSVTYVAGRKGQAVDIDGSSTSKVNVGSGSTIDNIWDGGGSFACWFNIDNNGISTFETDRICEKEHTTGSPVGWQIYQMDKLGANFSLEFSCFFGTTNGVWRIDGRPFTTDTWYHYAVTYNSDSTTNDPTIYVGGVSQAITETTTPSGTRVDDNTAELALGNRVTGSRQMDGQLDEIRLYSDILTNDEIKQIIAGSTSGRGLFGIGY